MTKCRQESDSLKTTKMASGVFDVAIIGAGVVGCAIARYFTLMGAKVVVLEKGLDILNGASKANSAILHTGFDAPPNSLELSLIIDGYEEYKKIHKDLALPIEKNGAFVVAWNKKEEEKLEKILERAHANSVTNAKIISANELAKKEPNLANHAKAAIFVPDEAIIDPWSAPYIYLKQAIINGAKIFVNCEVKGGQFGGGRWLLKTNQGLLEAKFIVNCAGLYGDKINHALLGKSDFNILPRKGQFVVFDKAAKALIKSIILPVPNERTKGVVIFRTIFGNLAIGPTAQDQKSRCDSSTDEETIKSLVKTGIEKIPQLRYIPITATYAGLRPASEFSEYQIKIYEEKKFLTVGAIRSTGLTGALGIAKYAFNLYQRQNNKHQKIENPKIPQANKLAENSNRNWQKKNHGNIICHCELVSEEEIREALNGPLRARSLAGLKRQTRVTMGRCQGFYCLAKLAKITQDYFDEPIACEINND